MRPASGALSIDDARGGPGVSTGASGQLLNCETAPCGHESHNRLLGQQSAYSTHLSRSSAYAAISCRCSRPSRANTLGGDQSGRRSGDLIRAGDRRIGWSAWGDGKRSIFGFSLSGFDLGTTEAAKSVTAIPQFQRALRKSSDAEANIKEAPAVHDRWVGSLVWSGEAMEFS